MLIDRLEACIRLANLYDWEDVQSSPVRDLILSALQTNQVSLQRSRWELYSRLAALLPEAMRGYPFVRHHGSSYIAEIEYGDRTLRSMIKNAKADDFFLAGFSHHLESRLELLDVLLDFYYWTSRCLDKQIPNQEQMALIQVPAVAKQRIEKRSPRLKGPQLPELHQYSLL